MAQSGRWPKLTPVALDMRLSWEFPLSDTTDTFCPSDAPLASVSVPTGPITRVGSLGLVALSSALRTEGGDRDLGATHAPSITTL